MISETKSSPPAELRVNDIRLHAGKECLLDQEELIVPAGKICLLLGPSGVGKSLMLRLIAGLIPSGEHLSNGKNVWWTGDITIDGQPAAAGRAGVVFQSFALLEEFTATDNIRFSIAHAKEDLFGMGANQWLDSFGIPSNVRTSLLSGGQRQRLAIARTLSNCNPLVLFDEPTSGLDPVTATQIAKWIQHSHEKFGRSSVIVTHDYQNLLPIADEVFFFNSAEKKIEYVPKEQWDQLPTRLTKSSSISLEKLPLDEPSPDDQSSQQPPAQTEPLVTSAANRTIGFLNQTTTFLVQLILSFLSLIPVWRSPRWGFKFMRQYFGLVMGPSNWVYMGISGLILGWVTTHFTFRFLPFRNYTEPLILENLISAIGFATYRIIIPVIGSVLVAAHCGAAVTADLGGKKRGGQLDALSTLGANPAGYLRTNVMWSFLVGMPLLTLFAFYVAQLISQVAFSYTHPELQLELWERCFYHRLKKPDTFLYAGTFWLIAKLATCGWIVGFFSYYFGLKEKFSSRDVSKSVTQTILWSTVGVLIIHMIFAFFEFPTPR